MSIDDPIGPRLSYRPPHEGIAAREDYPDAPIGLVLERSTCSACMPRLVVRGPIASRTRRVGRAPDIMGA